MYGGDGKSTFALPDLSGRAPMMWGQGAGLSLYDQGQASGSETVTLLTSEIPLHNHQVMTANAQGDNNVTTNLVISRSANGSVYLPSNPTTTNLAPTVVTPAGGSLPHNNMQPYLALYFIIAMQGVFPPRG